MLTPNDFEDEFGDQSNHLYLIYLEWQINEIPKYLKLANLLKDPRFIKVRLVKKVQKKPN